MNNDRSLTTTTKEIEMRREITVPNSPRNEKKDDIKTKTRKNEFDCINPRICFPSVISELKYMSNIYTELELSESFPKRDIHNEENYWIIIII